MEPDISETHELFLTLFAPNEPAIRAFVRRLVPTRQDAADAPDVGIQEVAKQSGRTVAAFYQWLHRGRLSASVPPEGIGFTVETPEAEVIDFGTEFSVDVKAGASEVHVFEGLVRVRPRSRKDGKAGEAVDLRTSQAVKIEDATERPVEIELATDRFIRTFDESRRRYPRMVKQLSPVAFYRMSIRDSESLWFGTDADGLRMCNGRIDELALFDKTLNEAEISDLYQAALEEMAGSK